MQNPDLTPEIIEPTVLEHIPTDTVTDTYIPEYMNPEDTTFNAQTLEEAIEEDRLKKDGTNIAEKPVIRDDHGRLLPGVVLNPAGKPKGTRHLSTLLMEAIKKIANGDEEPADRILIKKLIERAKAGDLKAMEMVFDRLEGKAPQTIEIETPNSAATSLTLEEQEKLKKILERSE